MSTMEPLISLPGEGEKIAANGIEIFLKAKLQQTNGHWSMIEYLLPPFLPGPPPHYHKKTQEMFYVLEGTLQFVLDGKTIDAPSGTLVVVPEGSVHTFKNIATDKVKFQVWFSPGGLEQYFLDVQELINNEPSWPPADMGKLFSLMAQHDTYPADQ
ncbi:cupin domain-containing protein [Segetibacter sp. 3557_3]|nr:cupin domain-containing protein [Segetibacter sp. 3557_3]